MAKIQNLILKQGIRIKDNFTSWKSIAKYQAIHLKWKKFNT